MALRINMCELTEGKSTGFQVIRDAMAANGNPEPIFYTDDQQLLFMVTLPCHDEMKMSRSATKITHKDVDAAFSKGISIEQLSVLLNNDISGVKDYLREILSNMEATKTATKSVSKSTSKLLKVIDALTQTKTRESLLKELGLSNHSDNYEAYIKPLLRNGLIELTLPEKPTSRFQEYRITDKGKQLQKQ